MEKSRKPAFGMTHQTKLELSGEILIKDKFDEWIAHKMPMIVLKPGERIIGSFDGELFFFDLIKAPSVAQDPSVEEIV